jgi:eukaryotic-like serine/threonine-protein kinase
MDRDRYRQRWAEADALFSAALNTPPEQREAFVLARTTEDPELQPIVLSLLASVDSADAVLPECGALLHVRELAALLEELATAQDAPAGQVIGRYRLVREIGRGGTGTVYLAKRDDGTFEQLVAVKLLRRGLDTDDVLARFRAERQILASLSHPSIARLQDGGAAADGRPYLVMELVEGKPITAYCDEEGLTVDERLALFERVAGAVQYAHRNLIVHRDLKPSNILVTADGLPKLLDFGIAKLMDPLATDSRPLTSTGVRPMTPAYASPEQVRGEPITTSSDVYQLGLLLYELLSGQRPDGRRSNSPREVDRTVEQQVMAAPSSAATDLAAKHRRLRDARALRRRLTGDLDTIVLTALRSEPERRYESAIALADDLARHRDGRPVSARRDRIGYRVGKFARRRPGWFAAALACMIVFAAFGWGVVAHAERLESERNHARIAAAAAGAERDRAELERARAERAQVHAEEERNRAQTEYERAESAAGQALAAERSSRLSQQHAESDRDRAEREAERTGRVTEFMIRLFEAADPAVSPGPVLSVREVLDRGIARVEELAVHPELHAELSLTMARAYHALGHYEAALPLIQSSLGMLRAAPGQALALAAALREQGELLRHAGDYAGAERPYMDALAIHRSLMGNDHPELARSLNDLGWVLREKGDYPGAESAYRESLAMRRRLLGAEHPDVATSLSNLGVLLRLKGDYAGAESASREALAMRRRILSAEHPALAASLNNLGILLRAKGDLDGAESAHREALAIRRNVLGDQHRDVALSLNNLGVLLRAKGDLDGAESAHREALAIRRNVLGNEHLDVATSLNNLGVLMRAKGDFRAAEPLLTAALAVRRKLLGDEHPDVASSLSAMGLLKRDLGEYDAAVEYLRAALDVRVRAHGVDDPAVATARGQLAELLARMDAVSHR